MGAKTDLFPTFSELCATAREVEKNPLSIPPRPIDGKLVLDENFGIFPREFEDYTYGFLLFEAQKIERRIGADAIVSAQQGPAASARPLTPEQQMQNDLRKFVSAQEHALPADNDDIAAQPLREKREPAPSAPAEVMEYERQNPTSREPSDSGDVPLPAEDGVPSPEKEAARLLPAKKEGIISPPRASARVLPPFALQKKSSTISAPNIPPAMQAAPSQQAATAKPAWQSSPPPAQPEPQAPSAKPSWQSSPKIPASQPSGQDAFEPDVPAIQQSPSSSAPELPLGSEAEKKAPAGISSYSKLSPRLQALMEQKLRREEERAKKAREDSDIFKTPPPSPPAGRPLRPRPRL